MMQLQNQRQRNYDLSHDLETEIVAITERNRFF